MSNSLSVGSDELRIIGHAVNWRLNVPYEHTAAPALSEGEAEILRVFFNDLCSLNRLSLWGSESVSIAVAEPYLRAGTRMQLPPAYFRMLTNAVASFFGELRSSPAELEVVTGLPPSKTAELLTRLRAVYPCSLPDNAPVL